jgi:urease accessory protein
MTQSGGRLSARARVVARAGTGAAAGTTVLSEIVSAGPLILRRTGAPGRTATVHLVAGAAGPLGGDRWLLDLTVEPGAALRLRSTGATLVLPDRTGAPSTVEIRAQVAPAGRLDLGCEPMVLAAGARLRSRTFVELATDSLLLWREEVVAGRVGETPGDGCFSARVNHDGTPLLANDLVIGPGSPWWSSSAVLGDARAYGTMLAAGKLPSDGCVPGVLECEPGCVAALARLAGPGLLATAAGRDVPAVRRALDRAEAEFHAHLWIDG